MRRKSHRSPRFSFPGLIVPRFGCGPCRGVRPTVNRLEDRTLLTTVSWINPAGGDWDTPSNWSSDALPGPTDDVVIALSGITVTHSSTASDSVNSLTISASDATLDLSNGSLSIASNSSISGNLSIEGGDLSVAGTLTLGGPMTWTGGTISGSGIVAAQAGLTLGGPSDANSETLDGATFENAGTATLSSGASPFSSGLCWNPGPFSIINPPAVSHCCPTPASQATAQPA